MGKFIVGAVAGAGLMYFLDPDQGNRRRVLLRDKAYKYYHRGNDQLKGKAEDFSNRAYGAYAETKSAMGLNKDEATSSQAEQAADSTMQRVA